MVCDVRDARRGLLIQNGLYALGQLSQAEGHPGIGRADRYVRDGFVDDRVASPVLHLDADAHTMIDGRSRLPKVFPRDGYLHYIIGAGAVDDKTYVGFVVSLPRAAVAFPALYLAVKPEEMAEDACLRLGVGDIFGIHKQTDGIAL